MAVLLDHFEKDMRVTLALCGIERMAEIAQVIDRHPFSFSEKQ